MITAGKSVDDHHTHIHATHKPTKNRVLVVKVSTTLGSEEELRAIRIPPTVSHAEYLKILQKSEWSK